MAKQVRPLTSRDVDTEVQQLKILHEVVENGPLGMGQLSQATGDSSETVRTAMRALEESGLITPTAQGAQVTDATRELLDEAEMELDERIELLERDEISFEPGAAPRTNELEVSRPQSSSDTSLLDRIRDVF